MGDQQVDQWGVGGDVDFAFVRRGEEGAEPKAKPLDLLYVPTFTYGHELWVVIERTRLRIEAAKMSYLRKVSGLSLRNRVRSLS